MQVKIFEKAQIAKFDPQERDDYESSLKHYRDMKNVIDTAFDEGKEEGREEIARNLLDVLDDETIAAKTGLTLEQVQALR